MDAYIAMGNVLYRWDANPKSAKAAELAPYMTASAIKQIVAQYQDMASHGLAYRGTPPMNHIKIIATENATVVLSNCQGQSKTDPYVQYQIATGKVVSPTGKVGPFLKVITVLKTGGSWKVDSIATNASKVCTP